jgi:hypothetical protein
MNIALLFDKDELHRSNRGSITAPVYFSFEDYFFPGNRWSDFVVVVLGWWLQSLAKILEGRERTVEFDFMDGPVLIRVSKVTDDKLKLECINQRSIKEVVEYTCNVRSAVLRAELLKVARKVIDLCNENGWESDDTRLLKKEISSFS